MESEESFMKYVTKEAIDSLSEKLNLPFKSEFSQDWEYEVADDERLSEFLKFYKERCANNEEKFALMIVIIGSYNELLKKGIHDKTIWGDIEYYLFKDASIHTNTILYWSLENEELDNCFLITPLIREVLYRVRNS
ncbi:MAG TPA: hypothetical protein VIR55_06625 [Ignavibacteria bacterium]